MRYLASTGRHVVVEPTCMRCAFANVRLEHYIASSGGRERGDASGNVSYMSQSADCL